MEGPGEGYTERQFRAHVSLYKMLGCTDQIKDEESAGLEGVAALTRLFQHVCSRGSDEGNMSGANHFHSLDDSLEYQLV